jgi:integrase
VGWLRQLPSGRWSGRYRDPDGKHSRSFGSKLEAKRFLARTEVAKEKGEWRHPQAGKVTFREVSDDWMTRKRPQLRAGSVLHYERVLKVHLLPTFGDMPLKSITPQMVFRWLADEQAKGTGANTLVKAYRVLSRVMDLAVRLRMIPSSPVPQDKDDRPAAPDDRRMRFLTLAEAELLAEAIRPEYRTWLETALWTGMRWSELAGLKVGLVNLMHRRVEVAEQLVDVNGKLVTGRPKTSAGRRLIDLPERLVPLLTEQIAGKGPDEYVFTGPTGKPMRISNFRKWGWNPALEKAGMKGLRIHDLRHTHVAWLIEAGEQMYEISRRLGHTKVSFTLDRYGHLMPERGRRTADALDRLAERNDQRISRLV